MTPLSPRFSKRFARLAAVLAGATLLSLPGVSVAADAIGKAEKIENKVTGLVDGQNRALAVPDAVHRDETIRTEAKAQAHLRFSDESDLKLGPDARLKLDAFVFSGKKDAAMELVSGTMRFVSGNGPKGSYLIKTPVATVGLRGTTVEVTVRGGRTFVSLHDGAAQICTRSGRCMDLTNACTFLSVDNRGVTLPQPLSRGTPSYSGQCTGDFCVSDRCSQQLSGSGPQTPGAAPPRATPPRATPPKKQQPRRPPPRRVVDDEYDVDEPVYIPPRGHAPPVFVPIIPGFTIGPGFGPRGPRYPGGRPQVPTQPRFPGRVPGTRGPFID